MLDQLFIVCGEVNKRTKFFCVLCNKNFNNSTQEIMTLIFVLLSSLSFVLLMSTTQVHGKALSVNNSRCDGNKVERKSLSSETRATDMSSTVKVDEISKKLKIEYLGMTRAVASDNIFFPEEDETQNRMEVGPDAISQVNKDVVEVTTVSIPNRVIFNSPNVCNQGEKKDNKGRCRKNVVSRFDEDDDSE